MNKQKKLICDLEKPSKLKPRLIGLGFHFPKMAPSPRLSTHLYDPEMTPPRPRPRPRLVRVVSIFLCPNTVFFGVVCRPFFGVCGAVFQLFGSCAANCLFFRRLRRHLAAIFSKPRGRWAKLLSPGNQDYFAYSQ